jgi:uncharacterized phage-associated protein
MNTIRKVSNYYANIADTCKEPMTYFYIQRTLLSHALYAVRLYEGIEAWQQGEVIQRSYSTISKNMLLKCNSIQGDPKRFVPIFYLIKNPIFNKCLFCCRT